eukprot:4524345-Pleurochrysis_carterae.AAC.1
MQFTVGMQKWSKWPVCKPKQAAKASDIIPQAIRSLQATCHSSLQGPRSSLFAPKVVRACDVARFVSQLKRSKLIALVANYKRGSRV